MLRWSTTKQENIYMAKNTDKFWSEKLNLSYIKHRYRGKLVRIEFEDGICYTVEEMSYFNGVCKDTMREVHRFKKKFNKFNCKVVG